VITPEADFAECPPNLFAFPQFKIAFLLSMAVLCFATASWCAAGPRPSRKHSEKPYALIYGTVWGPDNLPLYGVKIRIRRAGAKKPRWELYSDHSGEFAQRVPAGQADYAVSADLKSYKSSDGKHLRFGGDLVVHVENDERADIGLHLTE